MCWSALFRFNSILVQLEVTRAIGGASVIKGFNSILVQLEVRRQACSGRICSQFQFHIGAIRRSLHPVRSCGLGKCQQKCRDF